MISQQIRHRRGVFHTLVSEWRRLPLSEALISQRLLDGVTRVNIRDGHFDDTVGVDRIQLLNKRTVLHTLDLDGFKVINDTLGHDQGDALLRQVGERLSTCVREGDTVARLGGDEFIVMARELATPQQAQELGQSLLHAFEQPFRLSHLSIQVGLTIGYALAPLDSDDAQHLVRLADAAMYAGKENGKHCIRRNPGELALSS